VVFGNVKMKAQTNEMITNMIAEGRIPPSSSKKTIMGSPTNMSSMRMTER
jgi:hypothetical protein